MMAKEEKEKRKVGRPKNEPRLYRFCPFCGTDDIFKYGADNAFACTTCKGAFCEIDYYANVVEKVNPSPRVPIIQDPEKLFDLDEGDTIHTVAELPNKSEEKREEDKQKLAAFLAKF